MPLTKVKSGVRTLGTGEVTTANMEVDPTNASNLASGTVPSARLPSTGTSWQSVQTTGFTAVAGNGYPCNTTGGTFTCTLPATASVGDTIELVDYAGTFDTNQLTLDPQSLNIKGASDNLRLAQEREGVRLVYVDATQGWVAVTAHATPPAIALLEYDIEYMVVAGGGGGGTGNTGQGSMGGGGGGGGGYRAGTLAVSPDSTQLTVTVGAGGVGPTRDTGGNGGDGNPSVFSSITSTGGGGGGGRNNVGRSGGSGGGGSAAGNAGGAGTAGQGYAGGTGGGNSGSFGTGGGGGASEVGDDGLTTNPPPSGSLAGGDGVANDIIETGTDVTYAGGGGGCNWGSYTLGACNGGAGGGGQGGQKDNDGGSNGTDGLGGGSGGDYYVREADGGDGIVVLRMLTSDYSGTTTGSPTVTTDGSYKVLKYLSSGSYTT